jgi:uncharacterized protein YidB (DUF937 family)
MLSLLETLITFIGVMLVLALAAQSVQELVKIVFALKGQATLHGLRGLINEAVRAEGLGQSGDEILKGVTRRLQGLGQNGVRPKALRLDALTASQLADLVTHVDVQDVGTLRTVHGDAAQAVLKGVAERAVAWFPLAMDPVADRYRRRMRGVAFLSSAAVVWALNADALTIFRRAQDDDAFRQRISAATTDLSVLHTRVRDLGERCVEAPSACKALGPVLDSLNEGALRAAADTAFLAGITGPRRPKDPGWWVGILLSTLLVSLGAPFWHDTLETMFGIKNRVRAQVKKIAETTPPIAIERKVGPRGEELLAGPADEALPP